MQKNVVILLRTGNATGRNILAGILKRIKDSDGCTIRIASDADYFRQLAASASALIADTTAPAETIQKALANGKPVVLLNDWRFSEHPSNLGHIRTDDGEIGFKAADYFMSIGRFRSFGFVPAYTDKEWSVKRGRAFAHRLKRKGLECRTFVAGKGGEGDIGTWLKALPKPTAVFCAWDNVAADVAAHLGISRTLLDLRFREMATSTVGEMILEKRLSALSTLLRKSKNSIASLTKECGFGSVNHAKAVFRKRFGMTMRNFRNQNHAAKSGF